MLLPGPATVLSVAGRSWSTAAALLALPGRAVGLVDRVEVVVARVEALLDPVELTALRAEEMAARAGVVAGEADRLVGLSAVVAAEARGVVAGAAEAQAAVALLVSQYAPTLEVLRPTLDRLAETVDPHEVEAMVGLVDRLPPLLDSVDRDVLPLLGKLNQMAPDLHALLEAVNELRRTVAGLPGIGLLRRRGDDELGAEAEPPPPDDRPRRGATRARA